MEAMECLTADDIRKFNAAQTNVLCHWLRILYGQKEGSTAEKRERVWRTIVEKKVELPSHVWQAILEHTPTETMPAFDKKLKDAGPPTPSKLEAMELRVSE